MLPIALMTAAIPATRSSAAASAWPMTGIHETTRARMPAMPAIVPATSVITESTSLPQSSHHESPSWSPLVVFSISSRALCAATSRRRAASRMSWWAAFAVPLA